MIRDCFSRHHCHLNSYILNQIIYIYNNIYTKHKILKVWKIVLWFNFESLVKIGFSEGIDDLRATQFFARLKTKVCLSRTYGIYWPNNNKWGQIGRSVWKIKLKYHYSLLVLTDGSKACPSPIKSLEYVLFLTIGPLSQIANIIGVHGMIWIWWISSIAQCRPESQLCLCWIHYSDQPVPSWLQMEFQINLNGKREQLKSSQVHYQSVVSVMFSPLLNSMWLFLNNNFLL